MSILSWSFFFFVVIPIDKKQKEQLLNSPTNPVTFKKKRYLFIAFVSFACCCCWVGLGWIGDHWLIKVGNLKVSVESVWDWIGLDLLSGYLATAIDAAKQAGEIIRNVFYQTKHVERKGLVDLVTETDKACEDVIINYLKKHYPEHKFIGKETTAAGGNSELTDEPTWIVNPLDGTTNFVHGFPFVCISIGLTIGKVPTVGVVYNPILNELFTAFVGQGAHLNGKPIKVSSQSELVKSLLATEVRSLRMSGSCALNLCGIACGRLDLFYEVGFGEPWDVAGGAVIVKEAGGLVFDPSGKDFDITSQRVAASNPLLRDAFVEALGKAE